MSLFVSRLACVLSCECVCVSFTVTSITTGTSEQETLLSGSPLTGSIFSLRHLGIITGLEANPGAFSSKGEIALSLVVIYSD